MNNLQLASAMGVPHWFAIQMQLNQRYDELCADLRAIINDGDKAKAIVANVERKAESRVNLYDNLTYSIQLLEEQVALAMRGGYDNDYSVWRYSEDDWSQADLADKREFGTWDEG